LKAIPPSKPSKKDCFAVFLYRMKKRGIREIQHKKEKLNFGNARAVNVPLKSASKTWFHLIFNRCLFFDQIG
jgi:hypothetical protein